MGGKKRHILADLLLRLQHGNLEIIVFRRELKFLRKYRRGRFWKEIAVKCGRQLQRALG